MVSGLNFEHNLNHDKVVKFTKFKMAFLKLIKPINLDIQYKQLSVKLNFDKKISDLNLKREFTVFVRKVSFL